MTSLTGCLQEGHHRSNLFFVWRTHLRRSVINDFENTTTFQSPSHWNPHEQNLYGIGPLVPDDPT